MHDSIDVRRVKMPNTIALVDDDRNILTSVSMALETEDFVVKTYKDGEDALLGICQTPPDLAVVDIKMPRLNGIELLEKIRRKSALPVIFLTSKDDEVDELLGLRLGADDYITKPFSQRLLLERIKALLRRQKLNSDYNGKDYPKSIIRGHLLLDSARHLCKWKGLELNLTVTEFLLIETLAKRPGLVKTRDQLIDAAYGETIYVDDRTIDSHIKRLRRKFKSFDENFDEIETIYGIGYRYKNIKE